MRFAGPFAEYQLRALGRPAFVSGERVRCSTYDEALRLLRQIQFEAPTNLAPLLLEVDAMFGDGLTPRAIDERVARLIARGLIEVIRMPLMPTSDAMPEIFELPVYEPEPFNNEIDDGVSVLAEAAVEPAMTVEVMVEVEPAPVLELANELTPVPVLELDNAVSPPARTG